MILPKKYRKNTSLDNEIKVKEVKIKINKNKRGSE